MGTDQAHQMLAVDYEDPKRYIQRTSAVRLEDFDRMEQLAEKLLPYRGRPVVVGNAAAFTGNASHFLGLLAAELGHQDAAIEYLEEAVRLSEKAGALPWLARSRYELTRVVAARASNGDAEQAGELLAEASQTAERLVLPDGAMFNRSRSLDKKWACGDYPAKKGTVTVPFSA